MPKWILSPIERSCLLWIALGRSIAEIALLEGKSEADIRSYLEQAVTSVGASSIEDALRKMNFHRPLH
ncbi:hypothetical protein RTCIAT899_PB00710 (plasmid) [Rhizobium tropici CIAT 899]|nr:hypothetical protein RTCIAT899_PB00710 [Rhizobium tropici CIAT 899]AYG70363.1 hypothetical protein CCGE531_30380 [Rhizobium sp. CCGE531]AYG76764.1 hypothetical protein CCGE532_29990 [Rhizobium sp. CCGE532]TGE88748.1 hypothetical protein C9417_30930 [Rhizobium sp. SEMIA 4088]